MAQAPETMTAIVARKYGGPAVLQAMTVPVPVPKEDEVLIRVQATSINAGDWHLMRGDPCLMRMMFGLFKPKFKTMGSDTAGVVTAVGKAVTLFQVGDNVFGTLPSFGGWAEYVCVAETKVVAKPDSVPFEAAGALPMAGLTALQALRNQGNVQRGQRVLVNGASGGVGHFAVQIAKALGATVTAVCSGNKMEMVRSLGPDEVVDYSQEDVTKAGREFDVILDAAAFRPFSAYKPILSPSGVYVFVGGGTSQLFGAMKGGKRCKMVMQSESQTDLEYLRKLAEDGALKPFIDKRYKLEGVPDAVDYMEGRKVQGKVVITFPPIIKTI